MQQTIVKIQPKGVITIPKKVRDSVGFEENGFARIKKARGRIIIEPVRTLPYLVRTYKDSEVKEFFDLDEKETKKLKDEGLL